MLNKENLENTDNYNKKNKILSEQEKLKYIDQNALKNSKSKCRRNCFDLRIRLIVNPMSQFLIVLLLGFFGLLPSMISVIIIY